MDPATIAAIVTALGSVGASAIKKTDSPNDPSSILDWTYEGKNQQGRPSYNDGGRAYQYMSSHFKQPPPGLPEDRKIYDDNGRLLGWFADAGDAKTGFAGKDFTTKAQARTKAKMSPYQMNRGTEGEMWLGQRENIFRQDLDFSKRSQANQLSINQGQQGANLQMQRRQDYFNAETRRGITAADQHTRHLNMENEWQWQQDTAQLEGNAFRSRMAAQYPGASTWDLLSGGSASSAGPGAVPGIPGMPPPSMGTQRSGPDPSVAVARLQADNSAMQTIAQTKIAGAQLRVQEGIAKRNALMSFLNTAIEGAKTPAEITARAQAAKLATEQTNTETHKQAALDSQWQLNTTKANQISQTVKPGIALTNAQTAKTKVEAQNAAYGRNVEQLRRLSERGDITGLMQMLGLSSSSLFKLFRRQGIRKAGKNRKHSGQPPPTEQEWADLLEEAVRRSPRHK